MKKSSGSLVVLLALLVASSACCFHVSIPVARATYFSGPINLDTVWTLVDSPFVISGDVIINPGVTLTIEPAVQVRFGGNFSLIVEGNLIADGRQTQEINFTSNSPDAQYWGTILLNNADSYASLSNCMIEYATCGIMLQNGTLSVQNSQINNNGNGITTTGGTLETMGDSFENNAGSGVLAEDGSQVLIQNNNLTMNSNGITLATAQASQADIQQNTFLNNTSSGIALIATDPDAYQNTQITNNTLYNNDYGFYVSTSATTDITGNDVLNNTIGIFYQAGQANEAHFNDIYDNGVGMDVASNATVDATYNYWGDKSGPEHDFLNPLGKGNPVGGNGTDLKFIFFLTRPFENGDQPPTAVLQTDKTLVTVGQNVTFIGAESTAEGQVDQYFYSFGDGNSTGSTTLSMFNYSYSVPGTYSATLNVIDDFDEPGSNTATANITVAENLTPLNVAITLNKDTADFNESVPVTVYVSTDNGPVSGALVSLLSVEREAYTPGPGFTDSSGSTNSSGYFTTVFIAPNATQVSNVRIIATASMNGYADGSNYKYLKVLPPLNIQITPEQTTLNSQDSTEVTVTVTDSFDQPVTDAYVTMSVNNGALSQTSWITDSTGTTTLTFTAPQTLSQINATITVAADKTEYASGLSEQTIMVEPKLLTLEASADPTTVTSEESSNITAQVTWESNPIQGATITMSSDIGGSFSSTSNVTGSSGNAAFTFTTPQTTIPTGEAVNISITASYAGYVNAQDRIAIRVVPNTMTLNITTQPSSLTSNMNGNITVTCSSSQGPVPQANITVTSQNGGNFAATGTTDQNGNAVFPFTAPSTNAAINITIQAFASKTGYLNAQSLLLIPINPGNLTVQMEPSTQVATPTEPSIIAVHVTNNSTDIANATVTMTTNCGNLSPTTSLTNQNGICTFIFYAPKSTILPAATIIANATKDGYFASTKQIFIAIIPEATTSGWPLTTMLIIIIPIAIVAILAALIKLKVIQISVKDESE
jgi:parallel beta-helix repeat protein